MGTKINLYQNPRFNVGEMVIIIKKDATFEDSCLYDLGLFKKFNYSDKDEPCEIVLWEPTLHKEVVYNLTKYQTVTVRYFLTLLYTNSSKWFKVKALVENLKSKED